MINIPEKLKKSGVRFQRRRNLYRATQKVIDKHQELLGESAVDRALGYYKKGEYHCHWKCAEEMEISRRVAYQLIFIGLRRKEREATDG